MRMSKEKLFLVRNLIVAAKIKSLGREVVSASPHKQVCEKSMRGIAT